MALNYIWIGFFVIAFAVALIKLVFMGDVNVFSNMLNSSFDMAKTGFEISLGLTGVLALWMGIMRIGEKGGVVALMARAVSPLFTRLFPSIPKNHPVFGPMVMNFSMNMLGLDNAATPVGLKAMNELQELNPNKTVASDAQIMFLVLNTSGLTVIPVTIMAYQAQYGAANPADVFIPILLTTFFSTLAGLITVSRFQKIKLLNRTVLAYLGTLTLGIAGLLLYFSSISQEQVRVISHVAGSFILVAVIVFFIALAAKKKVNVYESFIDGARDGFQVAIKIIPYLVAMLVGIGVFRASGTLGILIDGISAFFGMLGVNTDFVNALPTAFMKPLTGGGARAAMLELYDNPVFGVDSFPAKVASVLQGSTETTFYVLAVYFGAVKIKNIRYAATAGLIADLAGIMAGIFIAYLFFH